MTADDMVSIPRELAERLLEAEGRKVWTPEGREMWEELDAILNPPPEFDVGTIRDIARELYLQAPFDDVPYEKLTYIYAEGHESDVRAVLAAARSAGWEMVRADELEALRELAAMWSDPREDALGLCSSHDVHLATTITQAQADAIRKAKAAQK